MRETLVYLHIHKAGGSSFNNALWAQFPREAVFRIDGTQPVVSYLDLVARLNDKAFRDGLGLITGHQLFGVHTHMPGRRCRYITLMREPVARTISLFNYLFHSKAHPLAGRYQREDFLEFLKDSRMMALDNGMTRMLSGVRFNDRHFNGIPFGKLRPYMLEAAKENVAEHIAVGFTEALQPSLDRFARELSWKTTPQLPHLNRSQSVLRPGDLTAEERALIEERNRFDIELHDFARAQHWHKVAADGPGP